MEIIDFARSYMTFFLPDNGNIARIQLDAACTMIDKNTGTHETFYLIAPCRGENMYLGSGLIKMPSYEYCGVWSDREYMTMIWYWDSQHNRRRYGENPSRFADVHLDIRKFSSSRKLENDADIVQATLSNLPIVVRTELSDAERGMRAVLEYPVKTMNVLKDPPRFQVDTGPVLLPDFASTAKHLIERLEMAYVVYDGLDRAEFVLRKPTPLPDAEKPQQWTTDYSVLQPMSGRHELFCSRSLDA